MQDLPNGGGGGAVPSIGPRALETLATPLPTTHYIGLYYRPIGLLNVRKSRGGSE